jgi:hypothetical protein
MIPGLFVPLGKGQRQKEKLDVRYNYKDRKIRFVGFEPLGADDLRLLQTMVALAGIEKISLNSNPKTDNGKLLRGKLDLKYEAINQKSLAIRTSKYELIKESGWKHNKSKRDQIKDSLFRMSNVTLEIEYESRFWSSHLISHSIGERKEDRLLIAINPRIAELMLGISNGGITYIDMNEARSKMNESTRILHQYLSAWIGPGKKEKAGIDKLIWHVWIKLCSATSLRKRKVKIRAALKCLNEFDSWNVAEVKKDIFEIKRSKFDPWKNSAGEAELNL